MMINALAVSPSKLDFSIDDIQKILFDYNIIFTYDDIIILRGIEIENLLYCCSMFRYTIEFIEIQLIDVNV